MRQSLVHVDPKIKQAQIAASVVVKIDVGADLVGARHDIGHIATFVSNQRIEGNVFFRLLNTIYSATCEGGSSLQGETGGRPYRDEIGFQGGCLLFIPSAALACPSQANNSHQRGTYHHLPYQFPQFYGTQI